MGFNNKFLADHELRLPVIMAPMFLVSNADMIEAAMGKGIAGVFPSLNYRTEAELHAVLERLNAFYLSDKNKQGTYGVNLIVQLSNPLFEKHLAICIEHKVPL